jgi:flap endonuclease-1
MGIKGLGKLIKGKGNTCTLETLKGSTIVIDTPIYLYKFKYSSLDSSQLASKFDAQIKTFIKNDITPIYIFDGIHDTLKEETQVMRRKSGTIHVTSEDKEAVKKLFTERNIKWVVAPTEAEKYCSFLNTSGKADYILSNDYDTFVFGCNNLVTFNNSEYILYKPLELVKEMGVSHENFIQACVAAGCDFCPSGIPGIGLKKAFKIIKKSNISLQEVATPEYLDSLPEIIRLFTDFTAEKETDF